MTLHLIDGFEACNNPTTLARRWGAATGSLTFGQGRRGGTCLELSAVPGNTGMVFDLLEPTTAPILLGLAWQCTAPASGPWISFMRGGETQIDVRLSSYTGGHRLEVRRDGILMAASEAWPQGEWHYLEVGADLRAEGGRVRVRVDQMEMILREDVNTQVAGSAGCDRVAIGMANQLGGVWRLDDLALSSGAWGTLRWHGDVVTTAIIPSASSIGAAWSVVGAGSAHQALDDPSPDDDSTYIEASTPGRAALGFTPLSHAAVTGRIVGACLSSEVSDADPGGAPNLDLQALISHPRYEAEAVLPLVPVSFPDATWREVAVGVADSPKGTVLETQEVDELTGGLQGVLG